MNTPYVKQYDENGQVINPIVGIYPSEFDNRRKRREKFARFKNNRRTAQMVIGSTFRYKKSVQVITDKQTVSIKRIEQYNPVR